MDVAVIGCGKAGENHVREIGRIDGARVVGVCDIEPLMAQQLAARFRIPRHFGETDAMLAEVRPQVVHVATPPGNHVELAVRAMEAGCHVVVEKPIAPTGAAVEQLLEQAQRLGRLVTVALTYHLDPVATCIRRLVADGVVGAPIHVECSLGYAMHGQFGAPVAADGGHWVHALPGGVLHNVIDHLLHSVVEYVRAPQPRVLVHAFRPPPADAERFLPEEVRIVVADETTSAYVTFSPRVRPVAHLLTLCGTRQTAVGDFHSGTVTLRSTSRLPGPLGRIACAVDQSRQHGREALTNALRFVRADFHALAGLKTLFAQFYEAVEGRALLPVAPDELLRVARLTDAVLAQLRDGTTRVT